LPLAFGCQSARWRCALVAVTLVAFAGATSRLAAQAEFDPHDFSGHWDRISPVESFANTPGGTRGVDSPGSREAPFTAAGREAFEANHPGYGPRRSMARNDPMGRCEPLGLVRNLVTEIVAPTDFEIVRSRPDLVLRVPPRLARNLARRARAAARRRALSEMERLFGGTLGGRCARRRLRGLRRTHLARQARLSAHGGHERRGALPPRRRRDARARHHGYRSAITPSRGDDAKRFRLNRDKAQRWDEQITAFRPRNVVPDLIGSGNVID
jgi:hypothetical protein